MQNIRTKLVTVAAVGAAALGGGAIANAASGAGSATATPAASHGTPGPGQPAPGGGQTGRHTLNGKTEQPLSGTTAAKVRAAALAKVSGTVERAETNVDSSAPYEAHIRKSDGTEVTVEVDKDYSVARVAAVGHP